MTTLTRTCLTAPRRLGDGGPSKHVSVRKESQNPGLKKLCKNLPNPVKDTTTRVIGTNIFAFESLE